jgi:hypothetical protein
LPDSGLASFENSFDHPEVAEVHAHVLATGDEAMARACPAADDLACDHDPIALAQPVDQLGARLRAAFI